MRMGERDKRALLFLAIAAPVLMAFLYGGALLDFLTAGSEDNIAIREQFERLYSRLESAEVWQSEIASKQKQLHVKVTHESPERQIDSFVKAIEEAGQRTQVRIASIRHLRTRSGVSYEAIIECSGPFPAVIAFVRELETQTFPALIDAISLTRSGGAGPQDQAQQPRQGRDAQAVLSASLQVRQLLFPEETQ